MGAKGEITKDKIIKATRHLFKRQGYRNTTIDDICNSSGVKRGNLYFYFKGKENLAYAVIADAIEREFPLLNRMMEDQSDPLAKVEALIDGMVQYIIRKDCQGGWFFGNFALEVGDTNRGLSDAINRFFIEWHALLSSLLGEAKEVGELRKETDCDALSRLIMSAMEGAILICKVSKDPASLLKTVETLKSIIASHRI